MEHEYLNTIDSWLAVVHVYLYPYNVDSIVLCCVVYKELIFVATYLKNVCFAVSFASSGAHLLAAFAAYVKVRMPVKIVKTSFSYRSLFSRGSR